MALRKQTPVSGSLLACPLGVRTSRGGGAASGVCGSSGAHNGFVQAASPAPAPLPFHLNVLAGAAAGGTELMVMYPLDLVKTRMQQETVRAAGPKVSVLGGLRNVLATEGPLALYRGILPPLLVEPMKRAVKFSSNAAYKGVIVGDGPQTTFKAGTCGALAGLTECFIIAPFEVVKVRLQSKARKAVYKNTLDCAKKIMAEEGPVAFAQGIAPALWRQGVWNGSYFCAIHVLKTRVLPEPEGHGQELVRNFTAGLAGGTLGTTLNTPFDVVTSRMRNVLPGEPTPYRNTFQSLSLIAREEGWRALWKGYAPKLARLGPGGGILLVAFDAFSSVARAHLL